MPSNARVKHRKRRIPGPRITAYGAAGEVTGSRYLIETARARVLLECGLFQGGSNTEARNRAAFRFDVASLDAVVLSHAHLDHSGLLPRLVSEGYAGRVHATPATCDLLAIMLEDAARLQQRDAQWDNKRRERAGKPAVRPLYGVDDARTVLRRCEPLPYGTGRAVAPGVELCLHDAGHILGSATVELRIDHEHGASRVVFSGDLGNSDTVLLRDPQPLRRADVLMLEATYGDRNHRSFAATREELAGILAAADRSGGNVLIPAFAVGRTQELLYTLGQLYREGRLPQSRVFLDSPMAIAATRAYDRHMELYDVGDRAELEAADARNLQAWLPPLRFSERTQDSMAINRIQGGAVIIAGSGMCNGGRICHHLKYNLWRHDAHVVFCGFQAERTPGRALVDGARQIRLLGVELAVKAQVHTLGGFSAHAGQDQLVAWARGFEPRPRLYLVHGEPHAMEALASRFAAEHGWRATPLLRPQPIFL